MIYKTEEKKKLINYRKGVIKISVSTTLGLNDGMSRVVREITASMQLLTKSIHETDAAIDKSVINDIDTRLGRAVAEADAISEAFRKSEQRAKNFGNSANNEFNKLVSGAKKVAFAVTSMWTGIRGAENLIKTSDTLTQITARLELMNDGLVSTNELMQKIIESANRSRGSFFDTANAVASLGHRVSSVFNNTDEIIAFTENINKAFIIAGATTAEMSSATLQLTQALGSGVLRGEELNAVFEAAPNIIQKIADYIDVDIGQIRKLASEGAITSDIIKNAILSSTDSINSEFKTMPYTFSQIWTKFKNDTIVAFQPVLNRLNEIANSQGFQNFISGISVSINILSQAILGIIDTTVGIMEVFSFMQPVIYGVAVALAVYKSYLFISNGLTAIATALQTGFNAALLACPLTWIIVGVLAVIGIFYGLIGIINKVKGTTVSASGVIVGIITGAIAVIRNIIADIANFIGNVFADPIGSVVRLFVGMADTILGILETIAKGIDFIFNTSLADNVASSRIGFDKILGTGKTFIKRVDVFEEVKKGYNWTKNGIGNFKDNTNNDIGFSLIGSLGNDIPDFSSNIANIDNNTASINKNLNNMGEDVKFIKDISERKYINEYNKNVEQKFYLNYSAKSNENDGKKMIELIKQAIKDDIEKNPEGVYA